MSEFLSALEDHFWSAFCFGFFILAFINVLGASINMATRDGSKMDGHTHATSHGESGPPIIKKKEKDDG